MTVATDPPNERINTPQPTIEQNMKTAAHELPKLNMGLVAPDVLVPFEEVSKHNVWGGYQTSAGHPTLVPMGQLRVAEEETDKSQAWKGFAEQILKSLPDPIQTRLGALKALSPEEMNGASFQNYDLWAGLNELVNLSGSVVAHLEVAIALMDSENALSEALLNSELASIVADNMAEEAQEMAQLMKEELKKRENDPAFDATNYLISQLQPLVRRLAEETERAHEQTSD